MGAMIKGIILAFVGLFNSLVNNLAASARGWGIPIRLTLLGPFRSWMYPKIFRSRRVKNAIARSIHKKIVKIVIIILIDIVLG